MKEKSSKVTFNRTELGKIPEDWNIAYLGDSKLADLIMGQSPPSATYNKAEKGLPFLQGNAEFGDKYPKPALYCSEPIKIAEKGDILISVRAPVGDINIAETKLCIGRGLAAIRPKVNILHNDFLYYHLRHNRSSFERLSAGSTFKAIRRNEFDLYNIPLPSLPEQYKIAEILSTMDEAIEKVDQAIEKTERLKKGLMQELLTKGIGHKEFKNTKIGRIPKEWEVVRLSTIFNVIDGDRGKNYPNASELLEQGHCLFLNAKNVTSKGLRFEDNQFISREKDQKLRKGKLKRGDIVITTRGTVGNIGLYDSEVRYDHIRINSGMVIIRNKGDDINFDFYVNCLQSNLFQRQVERMAYGSAQPQLSVKVIKNMYVLEFDKVEQKKIVAIIKSGDMKIELQKKKKENLERIKKGLMNDLLIGRKRVVI